MRFPRPRGMVGVPLLILAVVIGPVAGGLTIEFRTREVTEPELTLSPDGRALVTSLLGHLGAVATRIGRVLGNRRDTGGRVLAGAILGAVALAVLFAVTWKHSWLGLVLRSGFGFIVGAVLGFGFTVTSMALEQHGPGTVLRAVLESMKDSSGR